MSTRVVLTAAAVFGALVIAGGAYADHGGSHGRGHHGINGQYSFTGDSVCLWVPDSIGFNGNGQPNGPGSFTISNSLAGTLTIGGTLKGSIVLINGSSALSGPGVDVATIEGSAGTISGSSLTLSGLTGSFTGGALKGDTFKITSDVVLVGDDSQDHKTLVLAGDPSKFNVETVDLTNPMTGTTVFDRLCQYSIVAVRSAGGGESGD